MNHLTRPMLALTFLATPAFAGTLVDMTDSEGARTQFLSDDDQGRMNTSDDSSYMIVNYSDQTIKVVMPDRGQIMDLSGDIPSMGMPGSTAPEKVTLELHPLGKGPDIAGYSTTQYSFSANGENCGTIFGSTEAMNDTGLRKMFDAMQNMAEKQNQAMGGMQSMMSNCDRADFSISDYVDTIGAPMKSIDATGILEHEVTNIDTDAVLPADTFTIPSDYAVINMQEKMQSAQSEINKGMQQHMPQMQHMMEQMKQSGQMNPQMQQQLEQMMQQYQR